MCPAKAPRRGGGGNRSPGSVGTGGRSSFQVPSGGHPGAPRAGDVLDSLAAAAAVVSGGSTGPMDEGERGCANARDGGCCALQQGIGSLHGIGNLHHMLVTFLLHGC